METREYIISLFEEYRSLFTEKQQKYFYHYYFEDLNIIEISEIYGVSKEVISKTLNTVKEKLFEYENNLKLNQKFLKLKEIINKIDDEKIKQELEDLL